MKRLFLIALLAFGGLAQGQSWSGILDPSRAINWSGAGFTIPNYTTQCSGSPVALSTGLGNAAANASAIQTALATCDATHNVVNLPAGTYYVAGFSFGSKSYVVM